MLVETYHIVRDLARLLGIGNLVQSAGRILHWQENTELRRYQSVQLVEEFAKSCCSMP